MNGTYKDLALLLEQAAELVRRQAEENEALRLKEQEYEQAHQKYGTLADLPDVITAKEIAAFLRINQNTVYEMFKAGKIKSFGGGANGKSIRCMKVDFIEWLDRERNQTHEESHRETYEMPTMKITKGERRLKAI